MIYLMNTGDSGEERTRCGSTFPIGWVKGERERDIHIQKEAIGKGWKRDRCRNCPVI